MAKGSLRSNPPVVGIVPKELAPKVPKPATALRAKRDALLDAMAQLRQQVRVLQSERNGLSEQFAKAKEPKLRDDLKKRADAVLARVTEGNDQITKLRADAHALSATIVAEELASVEPARH